MVNIVSKKNNYSAILCYLFIMYSPAIESQLVANFLESAVTSIIHEHENVSKYSSRERNLSMDFVIYLFGSTNTYNHAYLIIYNCAYFALFLSCQNNSYLLLIWFWIIIKTDHKSIKLNYRVYLFCLGLSYTISLWFIQFLA